MYHSMIYLILKLILILKTLINIYVILSIEYTLPKIFVQMYIKIQKIKDNNITVYLNNLPFIEKAYFYTYLVMKEYMCCFNHY
jgi:hypothetical protein